MLRFYPFRIPSATFGLIVLSTLAVAGSLAGAPQAASRPAGDVPVSAAAVQDEAKPSYFTELWQLDKKARAGKPGVTFHRSNYALPASYNFSPNQAPYREIDPAHTWTKPEVTFQLSFKARLWRDMFGKDLNLWAAYTQRSFWQLYDFNDSSPFRETDYEPEVLLTATSHLRLLGLAVRFVQIGFNHQSNGQSVPLSRSWNRVVANCGIERGPLSVLVKGWIRLHDAVDDNPGLTHYVGNGELWGYYFLKKHRIAVMLRDNLNFRDNKGAFQLEWSFPMFAMIAGYVQYFNGYGESLLDYNHRVSRIGFGFIFSDWY